MNENDSLARFCTSGDDLCDRYQFSIESCITAGGPDQRLAVCAAGELVGKGLMYTGKLIYIENVLMVWPGHAVMQSHRSASWI
ncbi:hypothetical protein [Bradyrhizobium elkanii]|uniref:hypothetical protein n=1 Tax=Bradyrhizobium elkanii TaxID=29448 RepID=UPI002169AA83|nr:hypothetical protein [Bradyrhizobium elkanii]MCS3689074.1 hypothetical protein [Bradyrhizobium elkanii]